MLNGRTSRKLHKDDFDLTDAGNLIIFALLYSSSIPLKYL